MKVKILFNKTKDWAKKTAIEVEKIVKKNHKIVKKNADATVVIGGDGTILYYKNQIEGKLIGIGSKTSHMCHLNHFELNKLNYYLNKKESYKIKLIECLCNGKRKRFNALNDIFIASSNHNVIEIEAICKNFKEIAICDGLIISTPFGSTGYNRSAGGPILSLDSNMLALTWSNPTIYKTPYVFPYSKVSLKIIKGNADLVVDGKKVSSNINRVEILPSKIEIVYVIKD